MMMTNFKWSTILLVHVLLLLIVTEIYASPPTPPPENIVDEFQEQRNDLVVDKVKKIVYGWRKLSHQERNEFKNQVKEIPDDTLQIKNDPIVKNDLNTKVYKNIDIHSYQSYLYYYINITWTLDRTPDTDDYWVGIFKVGAANDAYITWSRIPKSSTSGIYDAGKLSTTHFLKSKYRHEQYELRIFKESKQLTHAVSNWLYGVVNSPSIDFDETNQPVRDEPEIEPKLEAFLSAVEVVANDASSELEEELLSASYYSQEELLQLWSEFNKQEQQLLFPILEQDSLPDEIKKPSQTQGPEPKELYPNLGDNQILARALGNEPKKITLAIKIKQSYTYVYPKISIKSSLKGEYPWVGLYKLGTNYNDPDKVLEDRWVWIGNGYSNTHETVDNIEEHNPNGALKNKYFGVVFDWSYSAGQYKQIGFAPDIIRANIAVGGAGPVPQRNGFPVDQALTMAQLSDIAYKGYQTVQTSVRKFHLHSRHRIYHSSTNTHGFIATNSRTVVVAFRGTEITSPNNFLTDIEFLWKKRITSSANSQGHRGFINALNAVYSSTAYQVRRELGTKKLYITGHSLGCGLASLFAYRLAVEDSIQSNLFGYGCPPTGDKQFSNFFKGRPSYIITNNGDPVSTGALTFGSPVLGLYKPETVFDIGPTNFIPFNILRHRISEYIDELKKLQQN